MLRWLKLRRIAPDDRGGFLFGFSAGRSSVTVVQHLLRRGPKRPASVVESSDFDESSNKPGVNPAAPAPVHMPRPGRPRQLQPTLRRRQSQRFIAGTIATEQYAANVIKRPIQRTGWGQC